MSRRRADGCTASHLSWTFGPARLLPDGKLAGVLPNGRTTQVVWHNHSTSRCPIAGVPPFVSSSIHFWWCMVGERFQVDSIVEYLREREHSECVAVDVGMNDGFYSMLFASLGCRVYAFEVQRLCVQVALKSIERNRIGPHVRTGS